MTRKINNYSFLSKDISGAMVDAENPCIKGKFCLTGRFTESWAARMGTDYCITSEVEKISEDGIVTTKNAQYELGTISPDYQQYITATRNGIQAVVNWNIYGGQQYGYYLTADLYPQRKSLKVAKIISQEDNFLTIKKLVELPNKEIIWADEEKVFVCWSSMSKQARNEFLGRKMLADDILYEKLTSFCGINCKPILKLNNP